MNLWLLIPLVMGGATLAGIVYALSRGIKDDDNGLMVTESGKPIRWDMSQGRIPVYFSPALDVEYRAHWDAGRIEIERAAGRQLFMIPVEAIPALEDKLQNESELKYLSNMIYVCDDEGTEPDHGRTTLNWDERTGFIRIAYVRLPKTRVKVYGYGITLHEQFHCLGFAHDSTPVSIMWPKMQERPGHITEGDKAILKAYVA